MTVRLEKSLPSLQDLQERTQRVLITSTKEKAGILDSGLLFHEMVAGVRFELTTFGLCDLTQLLLRVGLYLHPV